MYTIHPRFSVLLIKSICDQLGVQRNIRAEKKRSKILTSAEVGGHVGESLDLLDGGFVRELLHHNPVAIGDVPQSARPSKQNYLPRKRVYILYWTKF